MIGVRVQITKSDFKNDTKYMPYKDASIIYMEDAPSIVSNIAMGVTMENKEYRKVNLRKPMPVYTGDKFSSRAGQKGVISKILPEELMPFTEEGIVPSLIINPHAIPTRMTIGQLIEAIYGNMASIEATTVDADIFRSFELTPELVEKYGKTTMYAGINGCQIKSAICLSITSYQRLHKFANDTRHVVGKDCPLDTVTQQPASGGKRSGGGIRLGNMEGVTLGSQGASRGMAQKMLIDSDSREIHRCRCGRTAVANEDKGMYYCTNCKDASIIYKHETTHTTQLFTHELEAIGVGVKQHPEPVKIYI
jgi:DNA-directed RNA polymerase beta subunit